MLLVVFVLGACQKNDFTEHCIITPQGDSIFLHDSTPPPHALTFKEIKQKGQIRLAAIIDDKTYYRYNGQELGTQYLIAKEFAKYHGLEIVADSCKDSTEVKARLKNLETDLGACQTPGKFNATSKELLDSFNVWYNDTIVAYVQKMERDWLNNGGIVRHEYPMYIDLKAGHLSEYDPLFKKYARECGWDWKLLAAQCYQESTFDKEAVSFAGARGLMQIMPETAEMLGLPFADMFTPEMSIKAAAKYIKDLDVDFNFITNFYERQNFVLAAYNGGKGHIMDAIALAAEDSVTTLAWDSIAPYVLCLADARYNRNPVVKFGYMRGTETVGYVRRIRQIYAIYGGSNFLQAEPYVMAQFGLKREEAERRLMEAELDSLNIDGIEGDPTAVPAKPGATTTKAGATTTKVGATPTKRGTNTNARNAKGTTAQNPPPRQQATQQKAQATRPAVRKR